MVMSQSTYTFLACFSGFWLVWALVVMLCCFCSFLQHRLKRRHEERRHVGEERRSEGKERRCEGKEFCHEGNERCHNERLRERCLETEALDSGHSAPPPPPLLPPPPAAAAAAAAPPSPPQLLPRPPPPFFTNQMMAAPIPLPILHQMPQATWVSMPDVDLLREPPCYEEAVLMEVLIEDPPPPYSEVLADLAGGTDLKPAPVCAVAPQPPLLRVDHHEPLQTGKPHPALPDRGYSSLMRLPSSQHWDLLGHHLSHGDMDQNHSHLTPPGAHSLQAGAIMATMPRIETRTPRQEGLGLRGGFYRLHGSAGGVPGLQRTLQGFQGRLHGIGGVQGPSYGLPTVLPLLGRCTAV